MRCQVHSHCIGQRVNPAPFILPFYRAYVVALSDIKKLNRNFCFGLIRIVEKYFYVWVEFFKTFQPLKNFILFWELVLYFFPIPNTVGFLPCFLAVVIIVNILYLFNLFSGQWKRIIVVSKTEFIHYIVSETPPLSPI